MLTKTRHEGTLLLKAHRSVAFKLKPGLLGTIISISFSAGLPNW